VALAPVPNLTMKVSCDVIFSITHDRHSAPADALIYQRSQCDAGRQAAQFVFLEGGLCLTLSHFFKLIAIENKDL